MNAIFFHASRARYGYGLVLALCLWVLFSPMAQAATITVTTTADSGVGSLRQAVASAQAGDTILFDSGLSGQTIALNSGRITLDKALTIDGSALAVAATVSGNKSSSHFSVSTGATVTLTGLTLTNGKGNYGGAIYNGGTLTLNQVTVANNSALSGGAIYNVGTLTLLNSTVSGNSAFSGGGIDNYGTLTLRHSTFSRNSATNSGGGLYNAGTLSLYNSILADSNGGGDCLNANDPFFNLVGVIAANVRTLTEDGSCGAALSGDPKLATLALLDSALVHLPATTSPAVDAGDSTNCLPFDQRAVTRPQGSGCDLGAVEVRATVTAVWGDCNGDQRVNAGDLTATALEIFDGDGNAQQNAAGGSFVGTAGCDANRDTLINAGDLTCTALIIFNGPNACGTSTAAERATAALYLEQLQAELPWAFTETGQLITSPTVLFLPLVTTP